jgi:hypothetical protein
VNARYIVTDALKRQNEELTSSFTRAVARLPVGLRYFHPALGSLFFFCAVFLAIFLRPYFQRSGILYSK